MYKNLLKPLLDIISVLMGLILLSPLFVLVTIALTIANQGKHTLTISYSDFLNFHSEVALEVFSSYYKYEPHLNQTLTEWMHEFLKTISIQEDDNQKL